jgi:kynureninase
MTAGTRTWAERAAALDAADPLGGLRDRFLPAPGVVAYLDGNSLGRPVADAADRLGEFVHHAWGQRLIRGWTEDGPDGPWMDWPGRVGDRIAALALGAAAGQTVLGDSTTVLLYKLARAAVDAAVTADPARRVIVAFADDFPTDRYVVEGIAAERGGSVRWLHAELSAGVIPDQVADAAGPDTALVLLSHVAYRSGWLADAPAIAAATHDAGAYLLLDLCHSAGSVPLALDEWGVDLAVGCTYKFLNGGPGSPAFAYLRRGLQERLRQPIQGWMGRAEPFTMGPGYQPAAGVRHLVSGTPPILAAVPLLASLDLLADAGIDAVRTKSLALTEFALELVDEWLTPHGVELISPRDPHHRGGHITVRRPGFREIVDELWARGVLPDYREPDAIRIGPAPLSTSFTELHDGLAVLRDILDGT